MKMFICILFIAGLASTATGQDIPQSKVPSLVLNAFQTKFSNASDVEWELEGDLYNCEFEIGKVDHTLWIDKSGNVTKHKEEIFQNDLPALVSHKLKTDYKEYTIDDIDKIETNGKVFFKVDLDGKSGDLELLLLSDGTIRQGIE